MGRAQGQVKDAFNIVVGTRRGIPSAAGLEKLHLSRSEEENILEDIRRSEAAAKAASERDRKDRNKREEQRQRIRNVVLELFSQQNKWEVGNLRKALTHRKDFNYQDSQASWTVVLDMADEGDSITIVESKDGYSIQAL